LEKHGIKELSKCEKLLLALEESIISSGSNIRK
jgi:hypothetical protein